MLGIVNVVAQNSPPVIEAVGDAMYCPLTQQNIVSEFSITSNSISEVEAFYIQISSGYVRGADQLLLNLENHPTISTSWNSSEGKLTLSSNTSEGISFSDLINAIKDVKFYSSSLAVSGEKLFSLTLDEKNYLPSTKHYYEYVEAIGITWTDAKVAAENRTYYGLEGYLATVTSIEEAQLTGEQVSGAGWIGGSDAEEEGVWKWVTGPENGTIFWYGLYYNGYTPNFAYWNTNEPNQSGDEDYTHITDPNEGIPGSWNDLNNTGNTSGPYQPKGYIVEYGGMPGEEELSISASTRLVVPKITTTIGDVRCGSGEVVLQAFSDISEASILWFSNSNPIEPIHIGDTLTTQVDISTSFFVVAAASETCINGISETVLAQVKEIPEITTENNLILCEVGSTTLNATATSGIINWYANENDTVPLAVGETFETPTITSSSTFYVSAEDEGCISPLYEVNITIQQTEKPIAENTQQFCDQENPLLSDISITGENILWYDSENETFPIENSISLQTNTTYYASQTINGCESTERTPIHVIIHNTLSYETILNNIAECQNSELNLGFSYFNLLKSVEDVLVENSQDSYNFIFFEDENRTSLISNPLNYKNNTPFEQSIYVTAYNELDNSCFTELQFELNVNPLPVVENEVILKNCDEDGNPDGYTIFNLNEAVSLLTSEENISASYFLTNENAVNNENSIDVYPFSNETSSTVYCRIENQYGCFSIGKITLDVSVTSFPDNVSYAISECDYDIDNDGYFTFDLSVATSYFLSQLPPQNLSIYYYETLEEAQLEINPIENPNQFQNTQAYFQELYIRVENNDDNSCFGIGKHLSLTVYSKPTFSVENSAILCLNNPLLTLETYNPEDAYNYTWFNSSNEILGEESSLAIENSGVYYVQATSIQGCESDTQQVIVTESDIASITFNDVLIVDDSVQNSITILTSNLGIGNYEFALDNLLGEYQDEPFFTNIDAGIHTIYVRDKNLCGTSLLEVSVLGFPNFFTPNNDGFNDYWHIQGFSLDIYPISEIYIFDRFGKLLKIISPEEVGWDGTLNGKPLPSSDYWFSVYLKDKNGLIRERKGHFSLVRRD